MKCGACGLFVLILALCVVGCVSPPVEDAIRCGPGGWDAPVDVVVARAERWIAFTVPRRGMVVMDSGLPPTRRHTLRMPGTVGGGVAAECSGGNEIAIMEFGELAVFDVKSGSRRAHVDLPAECQGGWGDAVAGPSDIPGSLFITGAWLDDSWGLWLWSPAEGFQLTSGAVGRATQMTRDEPRQELILAGQGIKDPRCRIVVADANRGTLLRTFMLPLSDRPAAYLGLACSGGRLWFGRSRHDRIYQFDTTTGEMERTWDFPGAWRCHVLASPDGQVVVMAAQYPREPGGTTSRLSLDWFDVTSSGLSLSAHRDVPVRDMVLRAAPVRDLGAVILVASDPGDRVLIPMDSPGSARVSAE